MKLINVGAYGSYSGAEVESSYLLSEAFYKFVSQYRVFDNLGASELDGKHSYVEADKEVLEINELSKLDFKEDYFDDAIYDNISMAADEVREECEGAEWEEIISEFTEQERMLISDEATWEYWEEFRKHQIELAENLFEVPQKYKDKIKKLYEDNTEEFYEKVWKNGFLR